MSPWMLFAFIWLAWCVCTVAAMVSHQYQGAKRGLSAEQSGGISIAPLIPFAPLVFFAVAMGVDMQASPWGTWIIGAFRASMIVVSLGEQARDCWRFWTLDRNASSKEEG